MTDDDDGPGGLSRRAALRWGAAAALAGPLAPEAPAGATGRPAEERASLRPEEAGRWTAPIPGPEPVIGIHAVLLHTGQVLLVEATTAYLWDPGTGVHRRVDPPENVFCSGHAVLDDGDVLFVGGHIPPDANQGPPWNHTFRPATGRWTRREDCRKGRWYPTATLLPDGRALIGGGTDEGKRLNHDVEVYRDGLVTRHGEQPLWFYPLQHVLPGGRLLAVAPDQVGTTYLVRLPSLSFQRVPGMGLARGYAGSVLLPGAPGGSTRVMVVGGWTHDTVPHDSTQVFDAALPSLGWQPRAPLPQPRVFTNVVLLPDGTLLAVGGVNEEGPQRQTLLYDPALDRWRRLGWQTEARTYHSTALLLPDGRVLSAGDDHVPPGGGTRLEVFSPPYLFRGPRPVIVDAPAATSAGETVSVAVEGDAVRAVLMRPGSVTHSFDMSQRHVELAAVPAAGRIRACVPGPDVAVPGWYLLFVLDAAGVPSLGRWIHVAH